MYMYIYIYINIDIYIDIYLYMYIYVYVYARPATCCKQVARELAPLVKFLKSQLYTSWTHPIQSRVDFWEFLPDAQQKLELELKTKKEELKSLEQRDKEEVGIILKSQFCSHFVW